LFIPQGQGQVNVKQIHFKVKSVKVQGHGQGQVFVYDGTDRGGVHRVLDAVSGKFA